MKGFGGNPPRITLLPYGPINEQQLSEAETLDRVRKWQEARAKTGRAYVASKDYRAALVDILALQLQTYERFYSWQTYGDRKIEVPAGDSYDLTCTIDPRAYFAARQLLYFGQVAVEGELYPADVTIQLVEASGVNLFNCPISPSCLTMNGETCGAYLFPRDWIMSPGETFTIRINNRSIYDAEIDIHLSGTKIYYRPSPETRLPPSPAASRYELKPPAAAIRDYFVKDSTGQLRRVSSADASMYPGATMVSPTTFPGLRLIGTEPQSIFEFIREETDPYLIGALVEAYRRTYRFAAIGKDDIVVAAGETEEWEIPGSSDSYFVACQLGVSRGFASTVPWELQLTRSAGSEQLFRTTVDWRCFQISGSGMTAIGAEIGGTWFPLPEPWVIPPKEQIKITVLSGGGAVETDVHLLGYKVFCI